jgi:hypothetical protein
MDDGTFRIAMWSGPRNLSTAMMRSFGARADCGVWDEPFYAPFLVATGIDHPMRDAVIAAHETDPAEVARRCLGPAPGGRAVFYQKHMTHHMVAGMPMDWARHVTNVFLIRDPALVCASYEAKRERATLDDIGAVSLRDFFDREADRLGHAPPVLDATRIAEAPERQLRALCARIGLAFDPAMLSWPPGPRPEDGIWAAHWYGAVIASTGFAPPAPARPLLTDAARRLAEAARPHYEALAAHALTGDET